MSLAALRAEMEAYVPPKAEQAAVAAFIAMCGRIDGLAGHARHAALIAFARSSWWYGGICYESGIAGGITREAGKALHDELAAITPGRIWDETPYGHRRRTIERALRIDGTERFSGFATAAFRLIQTAEDEHWIAGAVGCCPGLKGTAGWLTWQHLDIAHVILWNPRTGELRVMGEAKSATTLVEPAHVGDRLTVYADGFSFFRDWADARARLCASHMIAKQQGWAMVPTDEVDSSIPGALVIGDLDKVRWTDLGAQVLVAGPGVDPVRLDRAIYRSARLPRVEAGQRRAA